MKRQRNVNHRADAQQSPACDPFIGEASFRAIIENSSDIIARFDLRLRCIYINRRLMRYDSADRSRFLGRTLAGSGLPAALSKPLQQAMERVRTLGCEQQVELAAQLTGGRYVFETRLFPELDEWQQLSSILCIAREITEASQARRLLTEENAVLEMIADSRPVNQIMHSICQMIESQLPDCMSAIMTLDRGGHTLSLAAGPSLPAAYAEQLAQLPIGPEVAACGTAAFWKRSIIVNDLSQSALWDSLGPQASLSGLRACWSTPIFTADHQLLGTLAIYYDTPRSPTPAELRLIYRCSHIAAISLQRNLHESQLYLLATQDGLTQLFNRRHFIESAERHLSQAKRYQRPVAVMMMDLDHFKTINDHYGHAVGDRVLGLFSSLCRRCLRVTDVIGRLGGEEFAAFLPDTTLIEARQIAERLRQQVAQTELTHESLVIHFQVSIGIAVMQANENLDVMLGHADKLLYQAKSLGRNRICTPEPDAGSIQQGELPLGLA
ncbi:sensor domain-containing diguanylate cyclase [Paludibacterium purpuratum]|uniref:diguanylate cyclase n=1 Tax=Paludibacterium purpuratum TaxID=1144873 RepID=A0A4R7B7Q7_9NEIS|nr:diguanylate cyclase [Paludibacterium purpuratum]TDR80758.1 PAS domain S-box-containing protein/diguanylate cyclase (GGDEF)-like protein [Paludibacterium purpuratum]